MPGASCIRAQTDDAHPPPRAPPLVWQAPRTGPAGRPAPFRQLARPRSRAAGARGGPYGASQVPECDNIGPGGIDIDQLTGLDATMVRELPEPHLVNGSAVRLGPRRAHKIPAASLSAAGV